MVTDIATGAMDRAGLSARIADALGAGSVLLIADAGFGKTTALRQALQRGGLRAAWVRCGDAGGDPGRLLGLIVEALRMTLPGAADALAERLAAAREPIDPEAAAAALERELAAILVERLVVVLDDAETLDDSPAALGVVARLLGSDSPVLRVALASRRRPALRLSRQRAAGRVREIGPAELAFSAAECAQFLRWRAGREPEDGVVEDLMVATEGWPLGVALAAGAAAAGRPGPSRDAVHEYFEEEVLAGLDPALRRALLAASAAPDLAIAQAAGVWPHADLARTLDRRGLFVGDDGVGERRCFHPLFAEFLRARLAGEVPPAERRTIAAQVADALVAAGRGAESVDHYIAAQAWEAAAAAIGREAPPLVRRQADTVAGWLLVLPEPYGRRPALTLMAGQLAHGQGRFADAVALCRGAVTGLDETAPAPLRFGAQFALGDALMAVGDLDGVAALAQVLDDPAAVGDLAARAVGVFAAAALARKGAFDDGRALFERALADPAAAALDGLGPTFRGYYLDLPAGRLDDALTHALESVATLEVADPTGRLPYALTYLMAIHEERGEDGEALAVASRTRARARDAGLAGWVGEAIAIRMASLLARAGDVGGAEAHLSEVSPRWRAWGAWEVETTRATVAAHTGDEREARAAADRAIREAQTRWPYFDRARCAALLAPVLAGAGHPGRARQIVETTIAASPGGFSTARLQTLLAWLLHDEGDQLGASQALAAAWAEAGDQARHLIRREWPRIERPLWDALAHCAITVPDGVGALAAGLPGGAALDGFAHHPDPGVRRAVLLAAVAAGRPEGIERVGEFARDPDAGVRDAARTVAERIRRDPPRLVFRLLGGFELRRATWLVDDGAWDRRVAQRLVRLLLCRGGGPIIEDDLLAAFWPDASASAARRSLQVAVSAARAVLDPPGVQESRLTSAQRTYRLRLRERDVVDADEFERAAQAALATAGSGRRAALQAAAALWGGEPLPEERYTDWAVPWRERLLDRRGAVLGALADAHAQAGDLAAAVHVARRLVELDPLDEAAQRRLILALARSGRRGHALRQFLACRHALVTTLGVEPGEETTALQRRLLAGEPV
ncbi:MAG TPA: BTAD domain-containing putative transcriptional regulator [Solirubrobacteraceae bacterium]|jgi:DNA-binding SARP family transcriptional activator|nr:BTAD domain-containing putative transcriptional regulator [Solirubrobacteraceae bacterium]